MLGTSRDGKAAWTQRAAASGPRVTGNSPTKQKMNWKSKTTTAHSSTLSGVGHHWIKMNLCSHSWPDHVLAAASSQPWCFGCWCFQWRHRNAISCSFPFPPSRLPPLPPPTAVVSNRKAALPSPEEWPQDSARNLKFNRVLLAGLSPVN